MTIARTGRRTWFQGTGLISAEVETNLLTVRNPSSQPVVVVLIQVTDIFVEMVMTQHEVFVYSERLYSVVNTNNCRVYLGVVRTTHHLCLWGERG